MARRRNFHGRPRRPQAGQDTASGTDQENNAIHKATLEGDIERVRELLESGTDCNAVGNATGNSKIHGRTALSLAAENESYDVVELLLEQQGIDTETRDLEGRTPLSLAAQNDSYVVTDMLLNQDDVDPNARDNNGRTPLSLAAQKGHVAIVELLLDREDIDVGARDFDGQTALSLAAAGGYEQLIYKFFGRDDVDSNSVDNHGKTPLLRAIEGGHATFAHRLIVDINADPNITDSNGHSPLWLAMLKGDVEIVEVLLDEDVDPNVANSDGVTPILYAAELDNTAIATALIRSGRAQLDPKNKTGQTPLSLAAQKGNLLMVELLLGDRDVDPNSKDDNGATPLLYAVQNKHRAVIEVLLRERRVKSSIADKAGRTAWSIASENGDTPVMKMLLEDNALSLHSLVEKGDLEAIEVALTGNLNVDEPDHLGRTPLYTAVAFERPEIARTLLKSGANVNSVDYYNTTCLQLAIRRRNKALINLLLQHGVQTDGIPADDWFVAYGENRPNIMKISESPTGEKSVCFFSKEHLYKELPERTTENAEKRHLLLFADYSPWQRNLIPDSDYPLQRNKLHISQRSQANGPGVSFSVGVWFPVGQDPRSKGQRFELADWEGCGITWTAIPPMASNYDACWRSVDHFSTLSNGWIPAHGIDFFTMFVRSLEEKWLKLCDLIEVHLADRRVDQLESKGEDIKLIGNLAVDAQQLAEFRRNLGDQVNTATEFAQDYCHKYDRGEHLAAVQTAIDAFSKTIGGRILLLDQTVRDLLQFEFAWVSVNEAHRSTSIARSMKRISWITFVFLPPMFISSIFGMNVNILADNPDWRWSILFAAVALILTVLALLLFTHLPVKQFINTNIKRRSSQRIPTQQSDWSSIEKDKAEDSKV